MKRSFAMIILMTAAVTLASCKGADTPQAPETSVNDTTTTTDAKLNPYISTEISDEETTGTKTEETPLIGKIISGIFGGSDDGDYPDKLYYSGEENAELIVFRVGERYFTFAEEDKGNGWAWRPLLGEVPEGMEIPDGGFARITADITRHSGGVAGFMKEPQINELKTFKTETLADMIDFCGIWDYDPEEIHYNMPLIYGNFLIFNDQGETHVYKDEEPAGVYGTELEVQSAIGFREMPKSDADMSYLGEYYLYVFRCGNTYLSYCPHIGMADVWTPFLDSGFENEPDEFTLEDGELMYVRRADIIKLNGGREGYVNVPLAFSLKDFEKVSYDKVISYLPPFWGEHVTNTDGDTATDYIVRCYPCETQNAMYDYYNGAWLVFWLDGKYFVYHELGNEITRIGVFDTLRETEQNIGSNYGG